MEVSRTTARTRFSPRSASDRLRIVDLRMRSPLDVTIWPIIAVSPLHSGSADEHLSLARHERPLMSGPPSAEGIPSDTGLVFECWSPWVWCGVRSRGAAQSTYRSHLRDCREHLRIAAAADKLLAPPARNPSELVHDAATAVRRPIEHQIGRSGSLHDCVVRE